MREGNYARGERHPTTTLSEDDVRRIRQLYAEGGFYYRDLAEMFGTTRATIGNIVTGYTWGHVA
jgi:hypothetical protein